MHLYKKLTVVRPHERPQFRQLLIGDVPAGGYTSAAATLGMTEGAAKMTVTRLRERYRRLLRGEIAQTVAARQAPPFARF